MSQVTKSALQSCRRFVSSTAFFACRSQRNTDAVLRFGFTGVAEFGYFGFAKLGDRDHGEGRIRSRRCDVRQHAVAAVAGGEVDYDGSGELSFDEFESYL